MQSFQGYGFLLKAPEQYYEAEYQELKGSIEKVCKYAEEECRKTGISNINFAIYVKETMFITVGIKEGVAEFALFDNTSSDLIQECSIYDFKRYVTEQRLDLFMCRIEKECKAVTRGQLLDRKKLDDAWNNKLVNSHIKEQDKTVVEQLFSKSIESKNIFEICYQELYESIKKDNIPQKNHCVIFLGGQPGAGKSYFYAQDDGLDHYIVIDGDRYRKYHPNYKEICENDLENMAERTQSFVNKCVERLIDDLSRDGYNLIIEGTLRDPDVPINTCNFLKSRGYSTELYVVAVDALTSWEATINRAKILKNLGETPRTVPIDKYNYIVNHLVHNLRRIENAECFNKITVIDRNNTVLSSSSEEVSPSVALEKVLNINKWNETMNNKYKESTRTVNIHRRGR